MVRTKNASNCTNYHYKIDYLDDEGEITQTSFFFTTGEITELFNVSRSTIQTKVKYPERNSHKLKNMNISKIKEPVFLRVENPNVISD